MKKALTILFITLCLLIGPIATISAQDESIITDTSLKAFVNTVLFSRTDPTLPITQQDIDTWDLSQLDTTYEKDDVPGLNQTFLMLDMTNITNFEELKVLIPIFQIYTVQDPQELHAILFFHDYDTTLTQELVNVTQEIAQNNVAVAVEEKVRFEEKPVIVDSTGYYQPTFTDVFHNNDGNPNMFVRMIFDYTAMGINIDTNLDAIYVLYAYMGDYVTFLSSLPTLGTPENPALQTDYISGLTRNPFKYIQDYKDQEHVYFTNYTISFPTSNHTWTYVGLYTTTPQYVKEVTVNYLDANQQTIAPSITLTLPLDTTYQLDAPTIVGHTVNEASLTGTMTMDLDEVNVTYSAVAKGTITLKFADENQQPLNADVTLEDYIGTTLNYTMPTIAGYDIPEIDLNTYQFTATPQVLTLTYLPTQTTGTITLYIVDHNNQPIGEPIILTGTIGDPLITQYPRITNYLTPQFNLNNVTYTKEPQEFYITYDLLPKGAITLRFMDSSQNKIRDDIVLEDFIGTKLNYVLPIIENYTPRVINLEDYTHTIEPQVITLVYDKAVQTGQFVIEFKDVNGNKIREDLVLTGTVGDPVIIDFDDLEGYTLTNTDLNGYVFTNEPQTLTLEFEEIITPINKGMITLKFKDNKGNSIYKDVVLEGNLGERMTYTFPTLDGYTLNLDTLGTYYFSDTPQEITIYYAIVKDNPTNPTSDTPNVETVTPTNTTLPNTGVTEILWPALGLVILGTVLLKKRYE